MRFIESMKMELKQQVADDIPKTVIAFANTNSGTIYVGIQDDGKVVGVQKVYLSAKELHQFPHLRGRFEE